jgi:ferredoxin, 2Fe-2S
MIIVDGKGVRHELDPKVGTALMFQLRPLKVGVIGLCNGNAACGTCHVYVEGDRMADLSEIDEFEEEMLAEVTNRQDNSRLACQLVFEPSMADLTLTVAPR